MDAVLRGTFIYFFLLVLFRTAGKRALAQIDTFDFVLLLIISEAAQNALVGQNFSMIYAVVLISTLVGLEIVMAKINQKKPELELAIHGGPLIVVDHGRPLHDRIRRSEIDEDEILAAAREKQGVERMEQIKYAVLENNGEISIVVMERPTEKPKKN